MFLWSEVDVRHKGRALKWWCFCECYIASQAVGKGEGVTQSVPPNLRALRKCTQKLSDLLRYITPIALFSAHGSSTVPRTNKNLNRMVRLRFLLVGGGGFEPPKSSTTDLQSAPFGHSGILPNFTPQSVLASLWYFAGTPSFCPHEEGSGRGLWSW